MWNTVYVSLAALMLWSSTPVKAQDSVIRDYCQWETFNATCPSDSVVVMESARYGRMEHGRCVRRDYGYVGCTTDVMTLSDSRCSGRHSCRVPIPDKVFDRFSKCPEDLRRYMQASYTCVKVVYPERKSCKGSDFARPTATSGYLASVVTEETGCGSAETPWLLKVAPGQKINLTLYDFGRSRFLGNGTEPQKSLKQHCHVYAILKTEDASSSVTICGGEERVKSIYLSTANQVEIRIIGGMAKRNPRYFLLHYQPVGCPDIPTPPGGWVQRKGEEVMVGCTDPPRTWKMKCNGTHWIGDTPQNCTLGPVDSALRIGSLPHASSVFIIVAVAFFVGLLVLVLGLIILRSVHRRQSAARQDNIMSDMNRNKKPAVKEDKKYTHPNQYPQQKQQPLLAYQDPCRIEENEYAYVDEIPRFDPVHENTLNHTLNRKRDYNNGPHGAGHYTLTRGSGVDPRSGSAVGRKGDTCEPTPQYFVLDPDAVNTGSCAEGLTDDDLMYEKQYCKAHAQSSVSCDGSRHVR